MESAQQPIWIVHDDPGLRDALVRRLAPAAVAPGPPELEAFRDAGSPAGILLAVPGPSEALERALQFAYEVSRTAPEQPFLVAHGEGIEEETIAALFAGLRFACVPLPPDREEVLDALAGLERATWPEPISKRRDRESLLARATEQLGGIGLEPIRLAEQRSLLIRGGGGTGRLLLARTVHALADDRSVFVHIGCDPRTDPDGLRERIARALRGGGDERVTFCLDGVDTLPATTQRELRGLVELGVPGCDPGRSRWIGLARRSPSRELRAAFEGAAIELAQVALPEDGSATPSASPPHEAARPEAERASTATQARSAAEHPPTATGSDLGRVALALAHELRNPLVPVQMLATLGGRDGDPDHERLREQVQRGIDRIENVLERLTAFSTVADASASGKRVDLSRLLERLLQERREAIQERRLLVMRHLESEAPDAFGDEAGLGFAFETLLDAVMQGSRERGDLYIASRHHPSGLRGGPAMRVLLRFHGDPIGGEGAAARDVDPRRNSLDWMLAEEMVRRLDGTLTIEAADGEENVVDVYLPAPGR